MEVTQDDLRDAFAPRRIVWGLLYLAMVLVGLLGYTGYISV